jgi:hypothetical protein
MPYPTGSPTRHRHIAPQQCALRPVGSLRNLPANCPTQDISNYRFTLLRTTVPVSDGSEAGTALFEEGARFAATKTK